MTEESVLQPAIQAEFLALADVLESTPDPQWDTPSLCEGWRVREVVAHMTMAARYSEDEFMATLRDYNFDFTRLSNVIARRDAELPAAVLIGNLRSEVMHHWIPPGGGHHGALNHVVIHGLDVTVPLGLQRQVPQESIRIVLDHLTTGGGHKNFGIDIDGRTLRATDVDWAYGTGPELMGAAGDLALAICRRALPAGRLTGDPL